MNQKPLLLIDAMNLAFRSHFAHKLLSDEDGNPTGMFYGFLNTLRRLKAISPRMIICWDNGLPMDGSEPKAKGWRLRYYSEYKASRKKTDDTAIVISQLPELLHIVGLLGYASAGIPGLEADDIIGILSYLCKDDDILIYSTDKDLYQLLEGQRVKILWPKKDQDGYRYVTQERVEQTYSIPIGKWSMFLALGGDSSDNIKPIDGVGPSRAIQIIKDGGLADIDFEQQPAGFRTKYGQYKAAWPRVQAAHNVTLIPITINDPRLPNLARRVECPTMDCLQRLADRTIGDREQALEEFTRFCATHNMSEFLAIRREFLR